MKDEYTDDFNNAEQMLHFTANKALIQLRLAQLHKEDFTFFFCKELFNQYFLNIDSLLEADDIITYHYCYGLCISTLNNLMIIKDISKCVIEYAEIESIFKEFDENFINYYFGGVPQKKFANNKITVGNADFGNTVN